MSKAWDKVSPEFREHAVRMVSDHRADDAQVWEAMTSTAGALMRRADCSASVMCIYQVGPRGAKGDRCQISYRSRQCQGQSRRAVDAARSERP